MAEDVGMVTILFCDIYKFDVMMESAKDSIVDILD